MVQISEETSGLEYVKKFAKQMLKNSIFIGTFREKRFVENLKAYRDVVTISNDETEFIENLMAVKKRIERELIHLPWVGITGPHGIGTPTGYNLWVELPIEVFGQYWFKVKSVDFLTDQVVLKLDVVRSVSSDSDSQSRSASHSNFSDLNINLSLSDIQFWAKEKLCYFFNDILTSQNIKTSIIFISFAVSALFLSILDGIKYLLDYLLKLINELSNLIKAITPIAINLINFFGRIIFGLYHLIATLFKRPPPPQPIYNAYVNYDPNNLSNSVFCDQGFPKADRKSVV